MQFTKLYSGTLKQIADHFAKKSVECEERSNRAKGSTRTQLRGEAVAWRQAADMLRQTELKPA